MCVCACARVLVCVCGCGCVQMGVGWVGGWLAGWGGWVGRCACVGVAGCGWPVGGCGWVGACGCMLSCLRVCVGWWVRGLKVETLKLAKSSSC